jgi:hypothetical protein
LCPVSTTRRVQWEQTDTVTENYEANRFVLDPNEGFGRNKRSKPLKSREEREEEDGQTFSDDDGEPCLAHCVMCTQHSPVA